MQPLTIAAGTDAEVQVTDAREDGPWTTRGGYRGTQPAGRLWLHHSGDARVAGTQAAQLAILQSGAASWTYGVPYNFVIFPGARRRIWYLNDVDWCAPHTYNHNCDVAICVWGNYQIATPSNQVVTRVQRLILALSYMWGHTPTVHEHRQAVPTECPGRNLSAMFHARGMIAPYGGA